METLGCAKNQVDAEIMSRLLRERGYDIVPDVSSAELAILNTCGFITSAKEEAIDRIIDLETLKESGDLSHLIVTGCLSERYGQDIYDEFPAVDLVLGIYEYGQIADRVSQLAAGQQEKTLPAEGDSIAHLSVPHESTSPYYAYLKIAEGCDQFCTYCAIPFIRGRQRSRHISDIVTEAKAHLAAGRKELIVIAQDIAAFGRDLYGEPRLATLIRALDDLDYDYRFRLLYANASLLTDDVIEAMERAKNLVPYLDMPIQHMSPTVLRRMGRKETPFSIIETIKRLRLALPKITLRSTVMVGFPGETARDFATLRLGLEHAKFERVGCFIYSEEEGTAAARLKGAIDPELAKERYEMIMADQETRMRAWQKVQIGTTRRVLLEGIHEDGLSYYGRSESEAPDVDPIITVYAETPDIELGTFVSVDIVEENDEGLVGVCKNESTK